MPTTLHQREDNRNQDGHGDAAWAGDDQPVRCGGRVRTRASQATAPGRPLAVWGKYQRAGRPAARFCFGKQTWAARKMAAARRRMNDTHKHTPTAHARCACVCNTRCLHKHCGRAAACGGGARIDFLQRGPPRSVLVKGFKVIPWLSYRRLFIFIFVYARWLCETFCIRILFVRKSQGINSRRNLYHSRCFLFCLQLLFEQYCVTQGCQLVFRVEKRLICLSS